MRKSKPSEHTIIKSIKQSESGIPAKDICRELASNSGLNIVDISHVGHNWTDFVIHKKGKTYIKNDNGMFLRLVLQKS